MKLKEFNIEEAKSGAKLCTRDGRPARIICYNRIGNQPIIALIKEDGFNDFGIEENPYSYYINGTYLEDRFSYLDLFIVEDEKSREQLTINLADKLREINANDTSFYQFANDWINKIYNTFIVN